VEDFSAPALGRLGGERSPAMRTANLAMEAHPGALRAVFGTPRHRRRRRVPLRLATEGAKLIARPGRVGSLEAGKVRRITAFAIDDLSHAGMKDPHRRSRLAPHISACETVDRQWGVWCGGRCTGDEAKTRSRAKSRIRRALKPQEIVGYA